MGECSSACQVISPAIDLVELKSGRGNVFLESAIPLTKSLHHEVVSLGRRIESLDVVHQLPLPQRQRQSKSQQSSRREELDLVVSDVRRLLERIDRETPLLQLAITASGESLATSLPTTISPSRLLQASTLLIVGDTQYAQDPTKTVQVGPIFYLSLYMLFLGHAHSSGRLGEDTLPRTDMNVDDRTSSSQPRALRFGFCDGDRKPTWQEVIHKARVRLCRAAPTRFASIEDAGLAKKRSHDAEKAPEYSYHLEIVEDCNDGRVHEDALRLPNESTLVDTRHVIPVHQISKIFYADTGRILNLPNVAEGESNPVLLLKRDSSTQLRTKPVDPIEEHVERTSACNPDEAPEQSELDGQLESDNCPKHLKRGAPPNGVFPPHLDQDWIAFEVFVPDPESGPESDSGDNSYEVGDGNSCSRTDATENQVSNDRGLIDQLKSLSFRSKSVPHVSGLSQCAPSLDQSRADVQDAERAEGFVARSPFDGVTSSLSLVEMLIRLAGLQEFQQASHISIPDHILTFFLEETSTTGLSGEASRRERRETRGRLGFDPYTDGPPA